MRLKISITCVVFVMTALTAAAVDKPNFSGTWIMDQGKSEGLPPDVEQIMKVSQADDKITLETKVVTDQGSFTITDSYTVNGKEADFVPQTPQGPNGKGKRTAKWAADGAGIEVTEEATFETPDGAINQQMTRKWSLSPDGKTLIIDLNSKGPQGAVHTKRTFVKKA
ncbi:MAG TPA: hypothetical protein VF762_22470 [Blastocatellia bacterium]